jgi:CheY-like chemotaxis protein
MSPPMSPKVIVQNRRCRDPEPVAREAGAAAIPVRALTAQAMHGDRERFLAAGFDGYISKLVDIVELVSTVRLHCERGSR